ncbi:monoheme cytochrome C [Maribacter sp. SA7]|uniref:monoheme cytochrome C n=1 Tax=Maribacter zhoushanensis TaxID=3030012 RepID=UPI0023EDC387|nr:monoheme cytochrome C [Maribacter zhoushanensis]MDF4203203.1 monoheme cytochrome C [Maribacter zhoushanensis]
MKKQNNDKVKHNVKVLFSKIWLVGVILAIIAAALIYFVKDLNLSNKPETEIVQIPDDNDFDRIENGIHINTGFIDAPGMTETIQNCTNCHSSKLVIQNRMSGERWKSTIKWMQETQNLWDLGENEAIIINYLVTNYPPKKVSRRAVLSDVEWYKLEE